MNRKRKSRTSRDGREGRDLTDTVTELTMCLARVEGLGDGFKPTEVWLGPRERAGLLAAMREKLKTTRDLALGTAVALGDPEETTLMGLTVRAMSKPGVRVGITYGEPWPMRAKSPSWIPKPLRPL